MLYVLHVTLMAKLDIIVKPVSQIRLTFYQKWSDFISFQFMSCVSTHARDHLHSMITPDGQPGRTKYVPCQLSAVPLCSSLCSPGSLPQSLSFCWSLSTEEARC